tara:strand:+ start:4312 stop:4881 length:570 start_codon:yes stop_codon:yes gene_type:complete
MTVDEKRRYSPRYLNKVVIDQIETFISQFTEEIRVAHVEAIEEYMDAVMKLWDIQSDLSDIVNEHYSGQIGNRAVSSSINLITAIYNSFLPEFLRDKRLTNELNLGDILPHLHVSRMISYKTEIPFSLLAPTSFDEMGNVTKILDMIIKADDGSPKLTQWAIPAIEDLIDQSMDIPDHILELYVPADLA